MTQNPKKEGEVQERGELNYRCRGKVNHQKQVGDHNYCVLLTPSVAVETDEEEEVKRHCSRLLLVSVRRNDLTPTVGGMRDYEE